MQASCRSPSSPACPSRFAKVAVESENAQRQPRAPAVCKKALPFDLTAQVISGSVSNTPLHEAKRARSAAVMSPLWPADKTEPAVNDAHWPGAEEEEPFGVTPHSLKAEHMVVGSNIQQDTGHSFIAAQVSSEQHSPESGGVSIADNPVYEPLTTVSPWKADTSDTADMHPTEHNDTTLEAMVHAIDDLSLPGNMCRS